MNFTFITTRRLWVSFLVIASSSAFIGCASTTNSGATGINRKQLLLVGSAEVNSLSAKSYAADVDKAKQSGALNKNTAQLKRLQNIAARLIPQTPKFRPDAAQWKWEVNVAQSDELNAYCAPGGKIMFYSGIIDRLNLSDDEIAAIMGHEMAHALREHGRERMSRSMASNVGLNVLAGITGMGQSSMQLASLATQLGLDLPFSRGQESESDVIGLELMAMGGYNPNASVTLWQKMGAANKSSPPKFMSTHPPSAERIATLQSKIPAVLPLYYKAQETFSQAAPKPVKRSRRR